MSEMRKIGRASILGRGVVAAGLLAAATLAGGAAAPPREVRTLNNSPDPLLRLDPGLAGASAAPEGLAPANTDPRNFEGTWFLQGYQYLLGPEPGVPPPLKPQYMKLLEDRLRQKNQGRPIADTATSCRPHGMPRIMESPYPIEILQTPGEMVILHEVAHNIRRIYMNRPPPRNQRPSYLGYSTARWEGNTLVVDTSHLINEIRIDDEGSESSDRLTVQERFTKTPDGKRLLVTTTLTDPVTLERPYSYSRTYHWRPDIPLAEYVCEENNRNKPDESGVATAK